MGGQGVPEPVPVLRVATYNIRKSIGLDWRREPRRILSVLSALRADVVALQEADQRFGGRRSTLGHDLLHASGWQVAALAKHDGGIGWHGNALLVRPPIAIEATHTITLPTLEPRGAVAADLAVDGIRLRIVGVHLGLTKGMRRRQAKAILAALESMAPLPTVLMGDLNTWQPSGATIMILNDRFSFAPPRSSFHASRPVAPLDRIAVSGPITLRHHGVHRTGEAVVASDHLPVWADVAVEDRQDVTPAEAAIGAATVE